MDIEKLASLSPDELDDLMRSDRWGNLGRQATEAAWQALMENCPDDMDLVNHVDEFLKGLVASVRELQPPGHQLITCMISLTGLEFTSRLQERIEQAKRQ